MNPEFYSLGIIMLHLLLAEEDMDKFNPLFHAAMQYPDENNQ